LLRKQQKNFRKIILRHSVQARCSLLTMSAATAMMSYNGINTRRHPLKLSYPDARINGRTCSFVFCTYCIAWNRLPAAAVLMPHSIILASCKPGFRSGLQPGFRQVRAGLRHAFDTLSTLFVENLVANLLHQSRHVEIDAAGSQQVRWFVRVLDKWNVEKNSFRASQRTC